MAKGNSRPGLPAELVDILARARGGYDEAPAFDSFQPINPSGEEEPPPALSKDDKPDMDIVEMCSRLDHSDVDNAERLRLHFGDDLLVLSQEKARQPSYVVWSGKHWDAAEGGPKSEAIAQKLGARIALEAKFIHPTEIEKKAIDAGKDALAVPPDERTVIQKRLADAATKADEAHKKRIKRRMDHAVQSKNVARIRAALACLAPHVLRRPDDFNADHMMFAAENATLRFVQKKQRQRNPKYLGRDMTPDVPEVVEVCTATELLVLDGHRRQDLITNIIPVRYDPRATCPRWNSFMAKMQPDQEVRRLIQVASGLSLVGLTVQKLFFHYGEGANGKSVYMETICRVAGDVAVTLPSSSIVGENGTSGGASPDLARLYGKRLLRVKELPEGEDLKESLVKELTGGETVTARDLFSGYMDFEALFVAMMSGNGYPRITGTDNGIWRRMAVVRWPIKIPEEEQREFSDMLTYFEPEYPGILNWMIEGVHIFLREGLIVPESVKSATQDYRDAMDRTAAFVERCIIKDDAAPLLQAKQLYKAYSDFTADEGGKPLNPTQFGLQMSRKFEKDKSGRFVFYKGIRLVEVPSSAGSPPADRFSEDIPWPEDFQ